MNIGLELPIKNSSLEEQTKRFDRKHGIYYKCNHCTYIFKKFSYLEKHMITRHSSISLDKYPYKRPCFKYKCELCEFECCSSYFLNIHTRIYHIEKNLKCETCNYFTKSEIHLKKHIGALHESIPKSVKLKSNDESKITQSDQLVQHLTIQSRYSNDVPESSDDSDCDIVTCADDSNLSCDRNKLLQKIHNDHLYALSPCSVSNKNPQDIDQLESAQVPRNMNQLESSQVPQILIQLESQVPGNLNQFQVPEVVLNCNPNPCQPLVAQNLNLIETELLQCTNEHEPQIFLSINGETDTIPVLDLRLVENLNSNHNPMSFEENGTVQKVSELSISNEMSVSLNTFDEMNTNHLTYSGRDKEITDDKTNQYSCHLCNYAADSQSNLIVHQSTHLLKTQFRCKKCKVFFENDVLLQRHAIWHRLKTKSLKVKPSKVLKCRVCHLTFGNESFLEKHKAWHRAMKAEKNSSKKFCTKNSLKNFCAKCMVRFASFSELKRHNPIHSVKCSVIIERLTSHNRVIKVKNEPDHDDNFSTLRLISDFDPPSINTETFSIIDQIKMEAEEIVDTYTVDKSLSESNTLTAMDVETKMGEASRVDESLSGSHASRVEKVGSKRADKSLAKSKTPKVEKGGRKSVDKSLAGSKTPKVEKGGSQRVEISGVDQSLSESDILRVKKVGSRILDYSRVRHNTLKVKNIESLALNTSEVDKSLVVSNQDNSSNKLVENNPDKLGAMNVFHKFVENSPGSIVRNSYDKFVENSPNFVGNRPDFVENSPDLVENNPDLVENKPDLVENKPDLVENNPDLVENNPDLVENNPDLVENNPDLVENNPDLVENNPDLVENNPDLVENNPDLVENNPDLVENNPDFVENNPDFVENNPDFVENNPDVVENIPDELVTKKPLELVVESIPDDLVAINNPDDLVKNSPGDLVAKTSPNELAVENNPCKQAMKASVCLGTIPDDLKFNVNPINDDKNAEIWIEREVPRPKPVVLDTITVDECDSVSDKIQKPPDIKQSRKFVHDTVVYDSLNTGKRKNSETKTSCLLESRNTLKSANTSSKKCKTSPVLSGPKSTETCHEASTKLGFLNEIDVTLQSSREKKLPSISSKKKRKKDFTSQNCPSESQASINPSISDITLPTLEIPSMISLSDIQIPDTELLTIVNVEELDSDSDSDSIKLYGPQSYPIENSTQLLTSIKIYNCDKCDFQSGQKYAYKKHRKLHFEKRKYVCDECGFRFKRKLRLNQHKLSHQEIDEDD